VIVEESLASGAMASAVARRHDVHPNQLHAWRRLARHGLLIAAPAPGEANETGSRFVPVAVTTDTGRKSPRKDMGGDPVLIDLVLRNGRILRLPESVPPGRAAALADTLEGLAR
jgi:hypothetical protein